MRRNIFTAIALTLVLAGSTNAQVIYTKRTGPAGYLGFSFNEEVSRDGAKTTEIITVREISKNSPAEKAGVKVGDEILRVNGMVATNGKFRALAGTLAEGDTVRLRVKREGKERDVTVIAAARPDGYGMVRREIIVAPDSIRRLMRIYLDSARVHLDSLKLPRIYITGDSALDIRIEPFRGMLRDSMIFKHDTAIGRFFRMQPGGRETWEFSGNLGPAPIFRSMELGARAIGGAEFSEMNEALAQYFNGKRGILTLRVLPETPAERAGLQPGDVILKAKGRAVTEISELRSIVASNPDGISLEISRKGQNRTLELKTRTR